MKSDVTIRDVMTREYVGVSESDTVLDVVELMRQEETGCVVVLRGSDPVGILTEWDVLGIVADESSPSETTAASVMSEPVLTVSPDQQLRTAAGKMSRENIRRLVAIENGEVVGVLNERDVIATAASFRRPEEPAPPSSAAGNQHDSRIAAGPNGEEYSDQSVCETCGSLSDTLREYNGQLVCTECREV